MKTLILLLFIPSICMATVKVAVLDSGLSDTAGVTLCEPVIDLTGTGSGSAYSHHGDNVTHIITDGLTNYCVYHIKVWSETKSATIAEGVYKAVRLGVDIINISGGGEGSNMFEKAAIEYAIFKGITVVAAAGNEGKDLAKTCYYPACYPGVVAVGNLNGKLHNTTSNYGSRIDAWEDGTSIWAGGVSLTGTSQACAKFTHDLLKRMVNL